MGMVDMEKKQRTGKRVAVKGEYQDSDQIGRKERTEKVKDKFQILFPVCLYRSIPNLNGSIQISEEQVGFGHDYSERLKAGYLDRGDQKAPSTEEENGKI